MMSVKMVSLLPDARPIQRRPSEEITPGGTPICRSISSVYDLLFYANLTPQKTPLTVHTHCTNDLNFYVKFQNFRALCEHF